MKQYKPYTPSRRHMSGVDYGPLSDSRPLKSLTKRLKRHAGRNNQGRITVRHQGGGNKALYRLVDAGREKIGVPGIIETIEYDPYRTAFIARVLYKDGERRYILASHGLKVGAKIITSPEAAFDVGNRTFLKRIPDGTFVYNVEIYPGSGGKLARAAGASLQILAN